MTKRKFRASDGEELEIIDERRKRKPKPVSRRRLLIVAGVAAAVLLVGLALLLLLPQTRETLPVEPVATVTLPAEVTAAVMVVTATEEPGLCPDIMALSDGRIALVAYLGDSDESKLYVMDTAGRDLCELPVGTMNRAHWSPDGESLALVQQAVPDKSRRVIIMFDIRTGERAVLTPDEIDALDARISPNGDLIALQSRDGSRQNIYTIHPDSSGLRLLTDDAAEEVINAAPAWSPDGQQIAFASTRNGTTGNRNADFDIYVMNADGSDIRQLTRNITGQWPAWSPDGAMIAFSAQNSNGQHDIFVMDANCDQLADGCADNMRNLTGGEDDNHYPVWLPGGQQIAYVSSNQRGDHGIYVVNLETGETRRITRPPVHVGSFDWWPQ